MRIVVASGKGGTGKTTIATSMARSLAACSDVWYVDCDVEAQNGHLFLNPILDRQAQAVVSIPQIQTEACTACGKCVQVCQYHALAQIGKTILVFPQLCHGCGSCAWNCPEKAITEVPNPIGTLEAGMTADGIHFSHGQLTISEPMATPVIRQLKDFSNSGSSKNPATLEPPQEAVVILDAPPGASCAVVETLRGADFALLVAEPTPFGLHDLKQMVRIVQEMGIPTGVVINRDSQPYPPLDAFCLENYLPVLLRIPFDAQIAVGLAQGKTLVEIDAQYAGRLRGLFDWVQAGLTGRKE